MKRRGVAVSIVIVGLALLGVFAFSLRGLLPPGRSKGDDSSSPATVTGSPESSRVVMKPGNLCPPSVLGMLRKPKEEITFSPIPRDVGPSYPHTTGSIFTDAPEPFSPESYSNQNAWWDIVGNRAYEAWAGALTSDPSDPSRGVLRLMTGPTCDLTQSSSSIRDYPTPTVSGSIRISQARGTTLTLVASDGTAFTFDAATGLYS